MENVADALKMAADVLVFVMALGISISSFSQAKQTAQIIVEFNDREYSETQYAEDVGQTDRIVGVESIIPTIWRAFNENIRVVFYENDNGSPDNSEPMQLYNLYNKDKKTWETVNYIDLKKLTIGSEGYVRNNFIMTLLYGDKAKLTNEDGSRLEVDDYLDQIAAEKDNSSYSFLQNGGLYDKIKGEDFRETIGVYYLQDLENTSSDDTSIDEDDVTQSNVPDANKTKLRVISYYKQ